MTGCFSRRNGWASSVLGDGNGWVAGGGLLAEGCWLEREGDGNGWACWLGTEQCACEDKLRLVQLIGDGPALRRKVRRRRRVSCGADSCHGKCKIRWEAYNSDGNGWVCWLGGDQCDGESY